MVAVWRIASDTPDYTADDLTGTGAKITGGRWNRAGTAVVYCSINISLALLETVAHLKAGTLPLNRYLVRVEIPSDIWDAADLTAWNERPIGWNAWPPSRTSMDWGEAWVAGETSALLIVPSAIVEEESNIVINPAHPHAAQITSRKVRPLYYHMIKRPES